MAVTDSIFDLALTTLALIKARILPVVFDNLVNEEPIHDATRDIDALQMNRLTAYLGDVGLRTRPGLLVPYAFSLANATAPQAITALARDGANDAARVAATAWRGGHIVGVAVWVENARTAGTLTITPTVNGVAITSFTVVIDGTNVQFHRANQLPGTVTAPVTTFSAKDRLGLSWTTDAAWAAGATPSVSAELIVSYGGESEAL